jgi:small nuclear ribonucleoprotein (snRNP)-like protein
MIEEDRMNEGMSLYEGKIVFILLRNNRIYNGVVKSVNGNFLVLVDKFQHLVNVRIEDIMSIEERGGKDEIERVTR